MKFQGIQSQERKVLERIKHVQGDLFIDIGAFIGEYCINLSDKFKEIWAFEPASDSRKELIKNLERFKVTNVKVFPEALSDQEGIGTLYRKDLKMDGRTSLLQNYQRFNLKEILPFELEKVKLTTLDLVIGNKTVDLLKIDTEGKEIDILKGSLKVLFQIKRIIIEIHDESQALIVEKLVSKYGFKVFERICECRYYMEK